MRLHTKLLMPWLLFSLVLVGGLGLFQWQLNTLQSELTEHIAIYQRAVHDARELRFLSQERLTQALEYRSGPLEPVLDALAKSEGQTVAMNEQLEQMLRSDGEHSAALDGRDQGLQILAAYVQARQSLPSLYRSWLQAQASGDELEPFRRLQLLERFRIVRAILDDLAAFYEITQDLASEEARASIGVMRLLFYGFISVGLLSLLGFTFHQSRAVAQPLRRLSGVAHALARGEPANFEVNSAIDEIDSLSHSLHEMLNNLQRSHAEVSRQEARFLRVVQAAPIGMVMVNPDGVIELANTRAEQMFGYDSMIGIQVESLVPASVRAHHPALRQAFLQAPVMRSMGAGRDLYAMRSDGSEFPVEIGLNPIETADGPRVLATIIDITERKQIERERVQYQQQLQAEVARRTQDLSHRTAELQAAMKDLEGFSYSVSHDLRAPLRAIDGFIEILLEEHVDKIDADGRRMFGVVQDNARKMGHLIDDILAFSRAGRLDMEWQDVDMSALVKEVWNELHAARSGLDIRLHADPLPQVEGDPRALRQIWSNLLGNAIKFSRTRQPGEIWVSAELIGDIVRFTVRDNGVGFKPEFTNKLFVLFQRLHGMDEFEGTGVGLAIVKRFVQKHGGNVSATAVPDQGATFTFELPQHRPARLTTPEEQPSVPTYH